MVKKSQSKTLLVFTTCGINLQHLAIEKEAVLNIWDDYDRHVLLSCNGSLPSCYMNPAHNLFGCGLCISRTQKNLATLEFDEKFTIKRSIEEKIKLGSHKVPTSLYGYSYKEIDVGTGVASSLISYRREPNIELARVKELTRAMLNQACSLVDQIEKIDQIEGISCIHLFNGRFYETHPLIEYCRKHQIDFITHEQSGRFTRMRTFFNTTPHSIANRKIEVEQAWAKANPIDKFEIASQWFQGKKERSLKSTTHFAENQVRGKLPEIFEDDKIKIGIFNSSEDEFKAIREWQHTLYTDQKEIIIRILERFQSDDKVVFYLRFHPNLKGHSDKMIRTLEEGNFSNLHIIPPESHIDSYALIESVDKILTFGSTVSIEAAYLGTPSIIYGNSYYASLPSLYRPSNFEDLSSLLLEEDLPSRSGEDLLEIAYYLSTGGDPLQRIKIESKNKVLFDGQSMSVSSIGVLLRTLTRIFDFPLWIKFFKEIKGHHLSLKSLKKL